MSELETAIQIASEAHAGQFRYDGKTPYITHPQAVAALLPDVDDKIVAWLHDVLEDNPKWTHRRLRDRGISLLNIFDVQMLTHHKDEGEEYFDYIMCLVKHGSKRARRVKIADLTHNLSCTPTKNGKQKYKLSKYILEESLR